MFTQVENTSNKPFKIVNLKSNILLSNIENQNDYGFLADSDPDFNGLPLIVMAKGSVNLTVTRLQWEVIDPKTNQISNFNNPNFSSFLVELLDVDNVSIQILDSDLKYNFYNLSASFLSSLSSSLYGDANFLRDIRIRITSFTLDNKTSQAVFVLNFPISTFSNVTSTISNGIFVNYQLSNIDFAKDVFLQSSKENTFSTILDETINDASASIFINNDGDDKLFYRLSVSDFYNTGDPFFVGQLKLNNICHGIGRQRLFQAIQRTSGVPHAPAFTRATSAVRGPSLGRSNSFGSTAGQPNSSA